MKPQTKNIDSTPSLDAHQPNLEDVTDYPLITLLKEARLLMGQERALQYRLTVVLRELDRRSHLDGTPMRLPRWLHDNFGLTFGTAREKVRTARALGSLPAIDTAFREGTLSYSKVRALTRVATANTEVELLETIAHTSAEGVEHIVRQVKQSECLSDVRALVQSRSLSTRWDDSGALVVQGRLTPEQGEVFLKALAKATEALTSPTPSGKQGPDSNSDSEQYWNLRADALVQVMADSLGAREASAPGDRHQVVVQVAAETLPGTQHSTPELATQKRAKNVPAGTLLHPETIRRLACDGGLVTVLTHPTGEPLNVGRKTRAIPPATRRALVCRDRHCQFPGCNQERYVEGHHIVHWARGGETRLNNLVLLCGRHHRAVHELGYEIRSATADSTGNNAKSGARFEFVRPGVTSCI